MFWGIAAALLFVTALLALAPVLLEKSPARMFALALALAVPLAGLWLYQSTGTPDAIDVRGRPAPQQVANPHPNGPPGMPAQSGQQGQMPDVSAMVAGLEAKLAENPDNLEGWLMLARTYRVLNRIPDAVTALENAQRLAPDNAEILVDLVEARIFASPNGDITMALRGNGVPSSARASSVLKTRPPPAESPAIVISDGFTPCSSRSW